MSAGAAPTDAAVHVALTTSPDEISAAALADALDALGPVGVGAFEIEDGSKRWEVGAYFAGRPDEIALDLLAAAHGAAPFAVSRPPERDWVAQVRRELTPVPAGRFVVHGGHDRARISPNKKGLEIEAAMAFGTGHHGTTEGCLRAIDWLDKRGFRARRAADVGCGTGVLAMALAKLQPARIAATDIDGVAAVAARENARINGVRHRIVTARAPGFRHARLRSLGPLDLVLANILARPLMGLAPEMARRTAPGSVVVLSGLLEEQAAMVTRRYRCFGFAPLTQLSLRGWRTVVLRRPPKGRPKKTA